LAVDLDKVVWMAGSRRGARARIGGPLVAILSLLWVEALSTRAAALGAQPVASDPSSQGPYIKLLAFVSLAAAFLFMLARTLILLRRDETTFGWDTRIGAAGWTFSDSWASNLTAVGALLGTVLAAAALPENLSLLSKAQYASLNLFFGVLAVIAAFIYNAVVAKKEVPADPPTSPRASYQTEGFVPMYLFSSMVTLWAVWGEIGTLYVMLTDAIGHARFTSPQSVVFLIGTAVVGAAAALYAWRTVGWNVAYYRESSPEAPPPGKGMAEHLRQTRAKRAEPLPRISLL